MVLVLAAGSPRLPRRSIAKLITFALRDPDLAANALPISVAEPLVVCRPNAFAEHAATAAPDARQYRWPGRDR
jgi:hypothetical protein